MSHYRSFIDWVHDHQEVVLDIVRIYLGIGLFVRGVLFITTPEGIGALVDLETATFGSSLSLAIGGYVTFAHLFGGLMLAFGLLTRIAALTQVPILVGAVFLVHMQDGLLSANQSLEFSALVLFLLGVVVVFGAGPWSADHYVFSEGADEEDLKPWWRDEMDTVARDAVDGAVGSDVVSPQVDGVETDEIPVVGASSGGTAVAARPGVTTRGAVQTRRATQECACGNDLTHPRVTVKPQYGWTAGFYFMLGISAPVKEIVFYCEECNTVMKRSRDPEMLDRYRWHTS